MLFRSLADEVKAGRFRADLLYRLDVFTIALPPLRQRRADLPGLAELMLTQLAHKYSRVRPLLKSEDLSALAAHDFPGNVRELRNVVERSLLKTPDDSRWLALDLSWLRRDAAATTGVVARAAAVAPPLPAGRELTPVEAEEYRLVGAALRDCHGGIRRAAARLGKIGRAHV